MAWRSRIWVGFRDSWMWRCSDSLWCSCLALWWEPTLTPDWPLPWRKMGVSASGVMSAHHIFKYRIKRDCVWPSFAVKPQIRSDRTEMTCQPWTVPVSSTAHPDELNVVSHSILDPEVVPASANTRGHRPEVGVLGGVTWEVSRGHRR